jgi:hypothetical protein
VGKCCIRVTRPAAIPFDVIGWLASRIGVDDYVECYVATRPSR